MLAATADRQLVALGHSNPDLNANGRDRRELFRGVEDPELYTSPIPAAATYTLGYVRIRRVIAFLGFIPDFSRIYLFFLFPIFLVFIIFRHTYSSSCLFFFLKEQVDFATGISFECYYTVIPPCAATLILFYYILFYYMRSKNCRFTTYFKESDEFSYPNKKS